MAPRGNDADPPAEGFWSGCGTALVAEVIGGAALLIGYLLLGDRLSGYLVVAAVAAPFILVALLLLPGRWIRPRRADAPDSPGTHRDSG